MSQRAAAETPPLEPSNEANQEQLQLARAQSDAYQKALDNMTGKEAHGEVKPAGDHLVGYAVEKAEGMYHLRDGKLEWYEPEDENVHVEVVVRDAADGRFIPGLTVYATLVNGQGKDAGTHQQPFL